MLTHRNYAFLSAGECPACHKPAEKLIGFICKQQVIPVACKDCAIVWPGLKPSLYQDILRWHFSDGSVHTSKIMQNSLEKRETLLITAQNLKALDLMAFDLIPKLSLQEGIVVTLQETDDTDLEKYQGIAALIDHLFTLSGSLQIIEPGVPQADPRILPDEVPDTQETV